MYMALKGLLQPWPEGETQNCIPAERVALRIVEEYKLSLGPLPEWSCDFNVLREIKLGAQLQTKDGRRIGNAWVTSNAVVGPSSGKKYFDVFTDAGNKCTLSEDEINEMFHIGLYLSEPDRVFRHFGRPD